MSTSMTNKLRWKEGDEIVIKVKVTHAEESAVPYRISVADEGVWLSEEELEGLVAEANPEFAIHLKMQQVAKLESEIKQLEKELEGK